MNPRSLRFDVEKGCQEERSGKELEEDLMPGRSPLSASGSALGAGDWEAVHEPVLAP